MNIKDIFKTAFPFISAAAGAGGPLGTMAAAAVGKALGVSSPASTSEAIADMIATATAKDPDAMLKLKQAEDDFALQMAKLGFDSVEKLEEIAAQDRASARAREIAVKDRIPGILALVITGGFFGLLVLFAFHELPEKAHDIMLAMLGSLGTAWIAVVSYYFGSSAGSAEKTRLLSKGSNGNT